MKKPAWGRLAGQRAKSEHSPLRITSKTGLPDLALARYVREAEVRTAAGQPRDVGLPCQARGDGSLPRRRVRHVGSPPIRFLHRLCANGVSYADYASRSQTATGIAA